ncbi:hypothetical protein E3N88_28853 [Mikania micrantha]|uniref:Uncharacterized protein n=1 Tax=Mikania micrantha TaxID=192012 RepID=A0A5N6N3K3_9ASTR|nr:hypothetical protein E3N88_28853 [Mikania micrantha]
MVQSKVDDGAIGGRRCCNRKCNRRSWLRCNRRPAVELAVVLRGAARDGGASRCCSRRWCFRRCFWRLLDVDDDGRLGRMLQPNALN